jgi:hypothetical protein
MASLASRSLKSLRVASRGAPRVASQRVSAASYSLLARTAVASVPRKTTSPNVRTSLEKHDDYPMTMS